MILKHLLLERQKKRQAVEYIHYHSIYRKFKTGQI